MVLGYGVRGLVAAGVLAAGFVAGAAAQTVQLNEPPASLLPASFGEWKIAEFTPPGANEYSLVNANKDALEECGPERSQTADYERGGRRLHVQAIQFADRTGAASAFTLMERPGMKQGKDVGALDAVGEGAVLFTVGPSLVLVGGATAQDVAALKPLATGMPKAHGNKGVAPLLPTLLPGEALVPGSLRYALGPDTYAAEGGVLPAHSLGWDKNVEAATAQYGGNGGKETLTVLLYPTPAIAGSFAKTVQDALPQMGSNFAQARVRREGPLVVLASGAFAGDAAQQLIGKVHLREIVATDGDMHPLFRTEAVKTYSLLANIAILAGVLMTAAVLLGFFLGAGRAAIRVMRGKPPAVELEFLSLHLAPQNKAAEFGSGSRE